MIEKGLLAELLPRIFPKGMDFSGIDAGIINQLSGKIGSRVIFSRFIELPGIRQIVEPVVCRLQH
jgi:hypothetical protein